MTDNHTVNQPNLGQPDGEESSTKGDDLLKLSPISEVSGSSSDSTKPQTPTKEKEKEIGQSPKEREKTNSTTPPPTSSIPRRITRRNTWCPNTRVRSRTLPRGYRSMHNMEKVRMKSLLKSGLSGYMDMGNIVIDEVDAKWKGRKPWEDENFISFKHRRRHTICEQNVDPI
jgi:hypothetical protein